MARTGHVDYRAGEYMELMEKYLKRLPISVRRGRRPGAKNRFLLDGCRDREMLCGEAELLVEGSGGMQFAYSVEIPVLWESRDFLLRGINGLNVSGCGRLSFSLQDDCGCWRFKAETRLQMDGCNCISARRQAREVYDCLILVYDAVRRLREQLPEFFGEEALEKLERERMEEMAFENIFEKVDRKNYAFIEPDLDEDAFVWNEETGVYDYVGAIPNSGGMYIVNDEDVDELLRRYESDGAESLSGSELVRLHIGMQCRLEESQAEYERLQQLVRIRNAAVDETGDMPEWDDDWGDEAEILRRAEEEGTGGMDYFETFCVTVARRREELRRERGLPPLYQPRGSAEGAGEDPGEKPVRNIPLRPKKK